MMNGPRDVQPFNLREQLQEDVLDRTERSMGVRLDRSTVVYGTQGMTAGFHTNTGTWVRVQWRRPWKIYGPAWAGAECASVLRGVAKPELVSDCLLAGRYTRGGVARG